MVVVHLSIPNRCIVDKLKVLGENFLHEKIATCKTQACKISAI